MAWCCDACEAEGVTLTSKIAGEEFHLCRRCYGKLILSLPKGATPEQVKAKLKELTGEASAQKPKKSAYGNQPHLNIGLRNSFKNQRGGRHGRPY